MSVIRVDDERIEQGHSGMSDKERAALDAILMLAEQCQRTRKELEAYRSEMTIDTSGEFRAMERPDGFYVVGQGWCLAVNDRAEGDLLVTDLLAGSAAPDAI